MGEGINSLNMWIAANHCGGESGAPGMDLLPQRLFKFWVQVKVRLSLIGR